jgi:iron complex outermembrane receptor protein
VIDKNAAIVADDFGTWDFGASWKVNPTRSRSSWKAPTSRTSARRCIRAMRIVPFQIHEYGPSYNLGLRATF